MIGDCPTPKEAQGLKIEVVVRRERIGRGRVIRCRMSEAENRHHRDRWHPRPLFIYRNVEREKRCSILPATIRVAIDFKAPAIGSEAGEVGVAGAAGLAGLPGVARQSSRRCYKLDHQESRKKQGRQREARPTKLSEP